MDPAIAGALIGGGFATFGVAASIWATSRTLHASRDEARYERQWEKQTAVYVKLLAALPADLDSTGAFTDDDWRSMKAGFRRVQVELLAWSSDGVYLGYHNTMKFLNDSRPETGSEDALQLHAVLGGLRNRIRDELQQRPAARRPWWIPPNFIGHLLARYQWYGRYVERAILKRDWPGMR